MQLTRTRNARDVIHLDPGVPDVTEILKGFGMRGAGNSHRPLTDISLEALELALEQWPIKAIQLTPNYNNPLGYLTPDAHKVALLTLAQRYDIPIIEGDVYADLAYHYPPPANDQVL